MSDLHTLPLRGHDLPHRPAVRARVFRGVFPLTGKSNWYWHYVPSLGLSTPGYRHGPFASWREAYDSARRMVELL